MIQRKDVEEFRKWVGSAVSPKDEGRVEADEPATLREWQVLYARLVLGLSFTEIGRRLVRHTGHGKPTGLTVSPQRATQIYQRAVPRAARDAGCTPGVFLDRALGFRTFLEGSGA